MSVIIKPFPSKHLRNIRATVRYMEDIKHAGNKILGSKVPYDAFGQVMSGSLNCVMYVRKEQILEINTLIELYGTKKSTQAASHQVISYPAGFTPTRVQVENDIKIYLDALGMQNHILLWDCHNNTKNFHVHLLLCRVDPEPDLSKNTEIYRLANNGVVKKKSKDGRVRTDEAACRQVAIARICRNYDWPPPENLRYDAQGKLFFKKTKKDTHTDATKAGERRSGRKSKERQLAEIGKYVFASAQSWAQADTAFTALSIEMIFKYRTYKGVRSIIGAVLQGPNGRQCAFGKMGKEYTYQALEKQYGKPVPNTTPRATAPESLFPEAKKTSIRPCESLAVMESIEQLQAIFEQALSKKSWLRLLTDIEKYGMTLYRSGGGLAIRINEKESIKASQVKNAYSLSKLEKILGTCPLSLPKKEQVASPFRADFVLELKSIFVKLTADGGGTRDARYCLSKIGASLEIIQGNVPKLTSNELGSLDTMQVSRDGMFVPLHELGKDASGYSLYSKLSLERADQQRWGEFDKIARSLTTWLEIQRNIGQKNVARKNITEKHEQNALTPMKLPVLEKSGASTQRSPIRYPELEQCKALVLFTAIRDFFCTDRRDFAAWLALHRFIDRDIDEGFAADESMTFAKLVPFVKSVRAMQTTANAHPELSSEILLGAPHVRVKSQIQDLAIIANLLNIPREDLLSKHPDFLAKIQKAEDDCQIESYNARISSPFEGSWGSGMSKTTKTTLPATNATAVSKTSFTLGKTSFTASKTGSALGNTTAPVRNAPLPATLAPVSTSPDSASTTCPNNTNNTSGMGMS